MRGMWRMATAVAAIIATPCASSAHAPYLLPTSFLVTGDHATILGAMTEDDYFVPEFALRTKEFQIIGPSGAAPLSPVAPLKDLTVLEAAIATPGTYRITTGDAPGRVANYARIKGKWLSVRPADAPVREGPPRPNVISEADVPKGAKRAETKGYMRAETYVTRGASSAEALATSGKGLELKPLTHPNEVYIDKGFAVEFLLDGKPLKKLSFSVYRDGNFYDDKKVYAELSTDAAGRATIQLDRPGRYILTTRYPDARPKEGETPPARTFAYSLTFEANR